MKWRDQIGNLLLLGCGIAFTVHFMLIRFYHGIYIYEDSNVILTLEQAAMFFIICYAVERMIDDFLRKL